MSSTLHHAARLFLTAASLWATVPASASPILVANNLVRVGELTPIGSELYFTEFYGNNQSAYVKSVPMTAGPHTPTTRVTIPGSYVTDNSLSELMYDDTNLYGFASGYTNGSIWKAPISGGSPTFLKTGMTGASLHAQDENHLYFDLGWQQNGGLRRIAKSGGADVDHSNNGNKWVRNSTFDQSFVYWQDFGDKRYYRTSLDTGATSQIRASVGYEYAVAQDNDHLYWYTTLSASETVLQRADKDGTDLTMLASNVRFVSGLGSDGSYAYFYDPAAGALSRVPVSGGTIEALFSIPLTELGWAIVHGNHLYFVDTGSGPNQNELYRLHLVPEPGSVGVLCVVGLGCVRRRRRGQNSFHERSSLKPEVRS